MTAAANLFSTLLGQEKAKSLLLRAYDKQKISHAYLFSGPSGVGKKRTARTFAALLLCQQPTAADACGQCPACRKMAAATHPDFLAISAQGSAIKIQQIRELKKQLAFAPLEADWRVILLADIQHLGREAANSLLKTLEEPPANTVFLLTANEGDDTLSTILSRCQRVPFFPLPLDLVSGVLQQEENIAADTAAAVAAITGGSLGRARELASSALLPLRRALVTDFCQLQPNSPEGIETMLGRAEECAALGNQLTELLDLLALWIRDHILLASNASDKIINHDLLPVFATCRKAWQTSDLLERLDKIEQAKRQLARNCGRALVCEVLFFAML